MPEKVKIRDLKGQQECQGQEVKTRLQTELEDRDGVGDGWSSSLHTLSSSSSFTEPVLPRPEPEWTQALERELPFGFRALSTSHLPLPEPNGSADVWPQQPPLPPSLGTWTQAEFFSPAREAWGLWAVRTRV